MVQDISDHTMPLACTLVLGQAVDLAEVNRMAAREAEITAEAGRAFGVVPETGRNRVAEPDYDLGPEMD